MPRFLIALTGFILMAGFALAETTNGLEPAKEMSFKAQLDGTDQKYLLRFPTSFDAAMPHDLMIALHGHGSDRKQYSADLRGECRAARDEAAKHGMIFVSPDYRGNSWMGPAAEADLVQLIGELKQKYKVGKVIVVGASMGGTSALIFTALHPDLIDGMCSQNGIASMMEYDNSFAGIAGAIKTSYGGGTNETLAQYRQRNPAEFRKCSPLFTPEKFTMPVAITVGGQDTVVPPATTIQLAEAVQKSNPNVLLINRTDRGHVTSYEDTVAALEFVMERTGTRRVSDDQYLSGSLAERISSVTQGWGELGFDTAAHQPGLAGLKLRIKDKEFSRGLGHHANGEIVVNLDGQFKTFQTDIGIQWQGGQNVAAVIFQIFADGREVFKSGIIRESDPPQPVTVPVENAQELRLVAKAAEAGIAYDCANWADARLIANPAAKTPAGGQHLDIAPFARVLSWDPKVMTGTKATRVEEMPAGDIFPGRELLNAVDGTYSVPLTNGAGSIGLQWEENRPLRRVALQLAAGSEYQSVELQCWTGESAWQGKWEPANIAPEKDGDNLTWTLGYKKLAAGTPKIRWVFSGAKEPLAAKNLAAFTGSGWNTVDVRVEAVNPAAGAAAEIEVYNGVLVNPAQSSPYYCAWDGAKPLSLRLRSSIARLDKSDRTVLRFRFRDKAFGVAVDDLLKNEAVYVPHAGLFVTREPAPITLPAYLKKITSRASVLEDVRAKPHQEFSQAWAAVHRAVEDQEATMVSLACDNRKFIVRRDGALGFNEYEHVDDAPEDGGGYGWLAASQWQLIPRFGSGQNPQLSRHLKGGWLPAPTTIVKEKGITYKQTTYVAPANKLAAGDPAWLRERSLCAVEYRIRNAGDEATVARLAFKLVPGRDPKLTVDFQEVPEGWLALSKGRVLALIDTRKLAPLSLKRESGEMVVTGKLPPAKEILCAVYLPAVKVSAADYAWLLPDGSWSPQMAEYWKGLFEPAMKIETPDQRLNDIIRASEVWCAVAARNEAHGARVAPWIASSFYGPLESEANSIIRGMDMTGHADFAERSLDYFLSKSNPAGFITTGYTLVGTAEVLWTLGENYGRTHDREWLRRHAPEVARICQWVMRQRAKTKQLDARGQKPPEYGLMPPGVTADWDRFAYRFFNDAQYYAGLELAGAALADIGDPAATAISEDAREYREDIERAFRWTQARTPVNALANGTWMPGDPSFLNCFGRIEDYYPSEDGGRTWCYSIEIGAHHLAATRVIDPASPEAGWMADYLEDVQFLRDGWGGDYPTEKNREDAFDLGGFAKVQPYYARIAEVYALRDDVKSFIRSYFNTIPSLVNAENLSFCEHFHNYGAWNKTHETGWFLCQTRLMFVMERGDELWLAPFVTGNWMKDGMKVGVRNAPTTFGKVSYELSAANGQLEAVINLPPHCTARKVVLRLRHPDGKPMRSVTVQGKKHADFDPKKETITFTPTDETMTIRARY